MTRKRLAVIGSGFGGLAVAIRLQAAGFQVTLYEKRDKPGGCAYTYKDQGFTFDAGPTVITAPTCLDELFQVSKKTMSDYVELMTVTPFYRFFWEDGFSLDYSNEVSNLESQIRKKSPVDVDGYRRFSKYSHAVFKEGYEKLAHVPFLNWWSMVRVSPQLIHLAAYRSVYQTVAKYFRDPQLRQAFSFHSLMLGGNPFTASSLYTFIHHLEKNGGVFFPKGGTGALIRGLVKLFTDLGGDIRLSSPVEKIVTTGGRVTGIQTESGQREIFDGVVSDADVVHTYAHLLSQEPLAQAAAKKTQTMRHSMSLFLIYFGTRKRYPHLAHHNVIFGPRYKELLEDIFLKGVLADDFSLYLHAPTKSDPSLAPEGCETFYVLSPVPHLGTAPLDWAEEGPRYAKKILAYLEKRYLPGLQENLLTQRIFTPADFQTELHATHGSAFSLEPVLTQSAFFRVHNRDPRIQGLYFVGAGTHPGAGIPGVMNSAKATANLVMEDLSEPPSPFEKQPILIRSLSGA
ncbi:MAG: Phytoene desaturase (lycopene-forming) [Elusimicrobia bacterium]|nr:Phytoene desaturase (lycopene-forming) [Elusimicrobiota bacterium]